MDYVVGTEELIFLICNMHTHIAAIAGRTLAPTLNRIYDFDHFLRMKARKK